jgi:hypothetical protein
MARSLEPTITSINDLYINCDSISIYNYPNPVSGTAIINITSTKLVNSEVIITIFNSRGLMLDKIKKGIIPTGITKIQYDAGMLPAGVYYYHTYIDKQKFSNKFIKY